MLRGSISVAHFIALGVIGSLIFQISFKERSKYEVMRSRKTSGLREQAISRSLMTQREKCQWGGESRLHQKGRKIVTNQSQQPFLAVYAKLDEAVSFRVKRGSHVPEKRFLRWKQAGVL